MTLPKRKETNFGTTPNSLNDCFILYATKYFDPNHLIGKEIRTNLCRHFAFATHRPASALDYDFAHIPKTDPAYSSYMVYKQANENVRTSIMISFGVTLQLFTSKNLANLTSRSDFDLSDLGRKKTAIFVVISDYDSTYNSISALFFIQAFQELYKLASKEGGTLPVPVRFLMDEFCNIGYIPDYTVKLSTMRSRGIFAQMIIQSLKQLENRYPGGLAAEIIGNSDTRIMMGANDKETAEYFSDMIGKSTVEQHTHNRSDKHPVDAGNISYRELARQLITPDEILRLPNKEQIILIRGTYPIRALKMDYMEHPNVHLSQPDPIPAHDPEAESIIQKIEQHHITIIEEPEETSQSDDIPIPRDDFEI